eukprot:4338556-Amphidinium_carterae.1
MAEVHGSIRMECLVFAMLRVCQFMKCEPNTQRSIDQPHDTAFFLWIPACVDVCVFSMCLLAAYDAGTLQATIRVPVGFTA